MRDSALIPSLSELFSKETLPTAEVTQNSLMLISQLIAKGTVIVGIFLSFLGILKSCLLIGYVVKGNVHDIHALACDT